LADRGEVLMIVVSRLDFNASFRRTIGMVKPMGDLQIFIDSTVLKGLEPYVPFREGILTKSGIIHTKIGTGKIIYRTPYARYQYYGKSVLGNELKYDTSRHALAGKLWFERYKADHLTELHIMVQNRVKGGQR
jgi:hypothetical protein